MSTLDSPGGRIATMELVVGRWLDAFNGRELDAMLAFVDPEVELHPLRVAGLAPLYRGHDGIRAWYGELEAKNHLHRIEVERYREIEEDRVLAVGAVTLERLGGVTPFSGLYRVADERIVEIHHYFTRVEMLESLGMLEPAPASRSPEPEGPDAPSGS